MKWMGVQREKIKTSLDEGYWKARQPGGEQVHTNG